MSIFSIRKILFTAFRDWEPAVLLSAMMFFVALLIGSFFDFLSMAHVIFLGMLAFLVAHMPMWLMIWLAYISLPLFVLCYFVCEKWLNLFTLQEQILFASLLILSSFFVQSDVLTRRDFHGGIFACLYTACLLPLVFSYHAGMSLLVPLLFFVQGFLANKRFSLLLLGMVVLYGEAFLLHIVISTEILGIVSFEGQQGMGYRLWLLVAFCAFFFLVMSLFYDVSSLQRKRCCLLGAGSVFLMVPLVLFLVFGGNNWTGALFPSSIVWALTVGMMMCATKRERGGSIALRPVMLRSFS